MPRLDLHTHSVCSDGVMSPTWVVERAAANGAELVALTDHDTLAGVGEAIEAGRACQTRVIAGVELGVDANEFGELHVLGYFPAVADSSDAGIPEVARQLSSYRDGRDSRARLMIERLAELGYPIDATLVKTFSDDESIGRPHVARALVAAGHVASVQEAFDRFLHDGGPAYVARNLLSLKSSVQLIHGAGGFASLAHPSRCAEPAAAISAFAAVGGDAVEVYYRNDDRETIARGEQQARRHGLLMTGGSDWHGLHEGECEPATVPVPDEVVDRLLAAFAALEAEAVG